ELSISLLILWQVVCAGNEENQRLLLTHPDVNVQLPMMLSSDVPEIQTQSLALLSLYSQTENGRRLLVRHQNLTKYCILLESINSYTCSPNNNDKGVFCILLLFHHCCPEYSFSLLLFLKKTVKQVNQPALTQCIGIMGDLCADGVIRLQMAENQECWQACLKLVVINLMNTTSSTVFPPEISERLTIIDVRCAEDICVFELVCFESDAEYYFCWCIWGLACCWTYHSPSKLFLSLLPEFDVLLKLLASENEMVVGNAAFCLSKCFEVPGAASSLLNSNIVMILLKHAGGEAKKTSVQENAAVALGKLCAAEPRHILQLRELNGMAILNSSMKYVQGL
uniref:Uncharacterized protein n=1 Tax=Chelonoidis abingdonii TaxID=106734 RepID=A0A8C0HDQ5_CHEAB